MDENQKIPDQHEVSPIRGLFHQNDVINGKHQDQEKKDQDVFSEEEKTIFQEKEKELSPFRKKWKAIFGKLTEIITQPEDSMVFSDENENFTDIFSDEKPVIAGRYDEPVITEPESIESLPEEIPEESEAVLFSVVSEDEGEEIIYDARPEQQKEIKSEFVPGAESKVEVPVQEDKTVKQETPAKKTVPDKKEIPLEAILQAKNSAALNTPITISAVVKTKQEKSVPEHLSVEEEKSKPEISAEKTLPDNKRDETVPAEVSEKIPSPNLETKKEKTAPETASAEEAVTSFPVKKADELSHNTDNVKPIVPSKPIVNELSHETVVKRTVTDSVGNNELSHKVEKSDVRLSAESSSTEEKPESVKPDFSEGKRAAMVYHYSDAVPFVVMAGKFTKTVRTEYENIRKYAPAGKPEKISGPLEPPLPPAQKQPTGKAVSKEEKESASDKEETATEIPQKEPSSKETSQKKAPKKEKKKFGTRLKDFFAVEDNKLDFEEEFIEEKPELNDYNSKEDVSDVRNEINESFSKVFVKTIVLMVTGVISLCTVFLAELMPNFFLNMIHNGWLVYGIINFVLIAVSVFVIRDYITNGFAALFHLRGNSDTAIAVASLAGVVQSITALFLPDIYLNGSYHLYTFPLILALLFNCLGKLVIVKRTADNFRFLRSKSAAFAGKIYTRSNNVERIVSGLPVQRPIVAYSKRSKFMSNFLQLSYAPDPVEDNASFTAPFTVAICILYSLFYGITTKDFIGGVSTFSLTSFITIPICCLLAMNLPLKNLCNSILNKGAMISGYDAVRQFSDTNAIMLDSAQLYPKGNIFLSGMRPFDQSKLKDAFRYAAAVSYAVDGPMSHIFETIIQDRKYMVPKVDSVSYDDGLGLTGWIGGVRVLIGNRKLMQKHNITIPDDSIETRYKKMGNELVYVSLAGELIVMFILTYKVDKNIAEALGDLSEHGVNIIVRTIDQNITREHIAEKFNLYQRSIKILPTGLGTICQEELTGTEKSSRAYLVTNGKLSAFAAAVSGCISLKSSVTISIIIQSLSVIIGFLLVMILSFGSGFILLSNIPVIIYTAFWCVAMMVISVAARKLSV